MSTETGRDVRADVRRHYGVHARTQSSCCGGASADDSGGTEASCCGGGGSVDAALLEKGERIGYTAEELAAVPEGAAMSLGCGNPQAIAGLSPGEVVVDLGSGAGLDCFLASRQVGTTGRVIGVDMTPEMIERARQSAERGGYTNVEFRLGEIEHLPVADASVDVLISNCVLNLSPNKPRVFDEAFRVLKHGGRLAISDVVTTADLPADLRADPSSVAGCVGGAASVDALESMLHDAGFESVAVEPDEGSEEFIREWDPERDVSDYIAAATIEAKKPVSDAG